MPCFSGAFVSPNKVFISFRNKVTVTVTMAPAVTTLVFSSSITIGKINETKNELQPQKNFLFLTKS